MVKVRSSLSSLFPSLDISSPSTALAENAATLAQVASRDETSHSFPQSNDQFQLAKLEEYALLDPIVHLVMQILRPALELPLLVPSELLGVVVGVLSHPKEVSSTPRVVVSAPDLPVEMIQKLEHLKKAIEKITNEAHNTDTPSAEQTKHTTTTANDNCGDSQAGRSPITGNGTFAPPNTPALTIGSDNSPTSSESNSSSCVSACRPTRASI